VWQATATILTILAKICKMRLSEGQNMKEFKKQKIKTQIRNHKMAERFALSA
jgi:hypothetical protein